MILGATIHQLFGLVPDLRVYLRVPVWELLQGSFEHNFILDVRACLVELVETQAPKGSPGPTRFTRVCRKDGLAWYILFVESYLELNLKLA